MSARRCVTCQYDLAGLPRPGEPVLRCPECGRVNVVEPDPPADEPMPPWWTIATRLSTPAVVYAGFILAVQALLADLPPQVILLGLWLIVVAIVRGVNLAARCSTFRERSAATRYVLVLALAANIVVIWAALTLARVLGL